MTIAELRAIVGASTELQRRELGGGLDAASWHDPMGGVDGWWWAVVEGELVHALGWTSGDRLARDIEIGRLIVAGSVKNRQDATLWS